MADVYRWLRVGNSYTYIARRGKGDDSRRGHLCAVVTVPRPGRGPGNALVVFADGHKAVVPAGALRKAVP
jgi:hypothetical protein